MSKYFTVASRAALIRIGCNKCLVHRTLLLRKPVFEQQEPTRPGHPEASSVDPPLVMDLVVAPAALPYEPMNASISIPDDGPLVNICVSLELDLQLDVRPTVVGSYSHGFIFSIHINSSLILLLNKVFFIVGELFSRFSSGSHVASCSGYYLPFDKVSTFLPPRDASMSSTILHAPVLVDVNRLHTATLTYFCAFSKAHTLERPAARRVAFLRGPETLYKFLLRFLISTIFSP